MTRFLLVCGLACDCNESLEQIKMVSGDQPLSSTLAATFSAKKKDPRLRRRLASIARGVVRLAA